LNIRSPTESELWHILALFVRRLQCVFSTVATLLPVEQSLFNRSCDAHGRQVASHWL